MKLIFVGAKIVYNMTKEIGDRVVSIDVMVVDEKNIPRYEPLNPERDYRCIASSFVADGGDGFEMISQYRKNLKYAFDLTSIKRNFFYFSNYFRICRRGLVDIDVVILYLSSRVVYTPLEGRLQFIT